MEVKKFVRMEMPLPIYQESVKIKNFSIRSIVAIAAGKGGVGKSTVTVNLARSLSRKGYRVGILDADIYGPSIRQMLPEDRLPSQTNALISPALSEGIKYISMAYFRKNNEAATVRAPIANGVIEQFLTGISWGELDFLLIDFPPGTGDIQLTLAQKAHINGALLVTTPQEVSVLDVRKAAKMFEQVKIPLIGILENMSYFSAGHEKFFPFGKGGGERLSRELGVPFLGHIPIDSEISKGGDEGKPLKSDSESANLFEKLAANLIEQINHLQGRQGDVLSIESMEKDENSLQIQWRKGGELLPPQKWTAEQLQNHCPCAHCVDEKSGQRRPTARAKGALPGIKSVRKVGRYAIQMEFTNGCSTGIFDFDYLRSLSS